MNGDARFGAWLKRQRRALDLSREELAGQISCSVSLVEKIETGERRPSRQIAVLLADRLGIPADQQPEFINFARSVPDSLAALPTDQAFGAALQHPYPHLPMPTTALIGRTRELAKLADTADLSDARIAHLQWCLFLAEQAEAMLHGPMQLHGLDTLEQVHDDLRAALVWSLSQRPTGAAEAGAAEIV